jgi:Phage tail lysozyme
MSEEDLLVRIRADISSVQSGAAQAVAAFRQMQAAATASASGIAAIGPAAAQAASGIAAIGPAATQGASGIAAIGPAAIAATGHVEGLSFATAGATKEFIVLGHEVMVGNFSRIPGSLLVLAERMGGLHNLMGLVSGSTLGWVGAAAAAAAALGYMAYQAFETNQTLNQMQVTLSASGQGMTTSREELSKYVDRLRETEHVSKSVALEAVGAFLTLPPALRASREEITRIAMQWAVAKGLDIGKTAEDWSKGFRTVSSAVSHVEQTLGRELDPAIKQEIETLNKAGDETSAFQKIWEQLKVGLADTSAWVTSRNAVLDWMSAIAKSGAEGAGALDVPGRPPNAAGAFGAGPPVGGSANVESTLKFLQQRGLTSAQAAGITGTLQQESGSGLDPTMENKSGHFGIAQWSKERGAALGITPQSSLPEQQAALWKELQTTEAATLAKVMASQTPGAAAGAFAGFERPEQYGAVPNEQLYGGKHVAAASQLYAASSSADPQAADNADAERAAIKLNAILEKRKQIDAAIAVLEKAPNPTDDQKAALENAKIERAKLIVPQKHEELEAEKASLELAKLQAGSDAQRLSLQQRINKLDDALRGGGTASAAKLNVADAQAQQAADDDATRAKIIGLQAQLAGTQDLRQQLQLKKEIASAEQGLARGSQVGAATAAKAVAEAEKQYSEQSIRDEERAADAKVRAGQSALGLRKAQLSEEVALHQRSQASEASEYLKAIDIEAKSEERLYETIVQRSDASVAEKEKAYSRIMEISTRAAEQEIREQQRVAQEIKRDADQSARAYVSLFDSAGSALTRFATSTQPLKTSAQQLVQSLGSDALKAGLSGLSQFAAHQISPNLEAGKGLSDLLGHAVAGAFNGGGAKDAGQSALQTAAKASADQLKIASEAQSKLNALLGLSQTATTAESAATTAAAAVKGTEATATTGAVVAKGVETTATTSNTAAFVSDTAAIGANKAAMAAGGGGGGGGIGGLLSSLPGIGSLFSGGGAAAVGAGGTVGLTSGTSALDAMIPALLALNKGGIVPSAAGGMLVPGEAMAGGGQLSILHPNELVLPRPLSEGIQSMIGQGGGGGGSTNAAFTYAPQLSSGGQPFASRAAAEQFFRNHGDIMMSQIRNHARNGWRG